MSDEGNDRALTRHRDAFEDRNLGLHFLLGMVSVCERLEPLVTACRAEGRAELARGAVSKGAVSKAAVSKAADATDEASPDDALLYAMLGVVALQSSVGELALSLRSVAVAEHAAAEASVPWGRGELR